MELLAEEGTELALLEAGEGGGGRPAWGGGGYRTPHSQGYLAPLIHIQRCLLPSPHPLAPPTQKVVVLGGARGGVENEAAVVPG